MKYLLAKLSIIALILNSMIINAQNKDLVVSIHESTINKLLDAVGVISDTDEYKITLIKGTYNWQVKNTKVHLEKNKAYFTTTVRVETGPFNYTDNIKGNLEVVYRPETNKLILTLESAEFKIKAKILGKERIIKTLDVASFYKEPIVFDGPIAMEQIFEFEMPSGEIKKLKAVINDCQIEVLDDKIDLKAIFDFEEVKKVTNKTENKTQAAKPKTDSKTETVKTQEETKKDKKKAIKK